MKMGSIELVENLYNEAQKYGIERINSVVLLKVLLENDESPLYDAIFSQIDPIQYSEMISICIQNYPIQSVFTRLVSVTKKYFNRNKKEQEECGFAIQYTYNNQIKYIIFDKELKSILKILQSSDFETIDVEAVSMALIEDMPKQIRMIFRTFGINVNILKQRLFGEKAYILSKENDDISIPKKLSKYVKNLTEEFKENKKTISGRKKECGYIWDVFQKASRNNVVLTGEHGVGKKTIVYKIVSDISEGTCPEQFKEYTVYKFNVDDFISEEQSSGFTDTSITDLILFFSKLKNAIVCIEKINVLKEIEGFYIIKSLINNSNVRIIGISDKKYQDIFSFDEHFIQININVPKNEEIFEMLKDQIDELSIHHGVSISKEMFDFVVLYATCFYADVNKFDRTLDLIDR